MKDAGLLVTVVSMIKSRIIRRWCCVTRMEKMGNAYKTQAWKFQSEVIHVF